MSRKILMLASAACFAALVMSQASAATSCTEAEMTKTEAAISKMTDATKKASAMKELQLAKDMMAKKDMAACSLHLTDATTLANPG